MRDVIPRGLDWPYGPNTHPHMRPLLLEWARDRSLTLMDVGSKLSRFDRRLASKQPFGVESDYCATTASYADHVTYWKRDGQPAMILFQPYGPRSWYEDEAQAEADRLGMILNISVGWYQFEDRGPVIYGYEFWL